MIFVTVGTHEQPFNRLVKKIDDLVADGTIKEKVVIQTGFSTYQPVHCDNHKMMSFEEMQNTLKEARIVITHGGPSSFIEALQFGKVPIVVPRQEKYHEHVNNHQVDFTELIDRKMNNIIPVYNTEKLKDTLLNYENIVLTKNSGENSNNKLFNKKLENIINDNMKKVGIMSMQRIYNYGSFLQAYGLRKIFQSLNTDVKFIDYHPGKPLVDNSDKNGILRKLSKALETLVISAPFKTKLDYINYKRTWNKGGTLL